MRAKGKKVRNRNLSLSRSNERSEDGLLRRTTRTLLQSAGLTELALLPPLPPVPIGGRTTLAPLPPPLLDPIQDHAPLNLLGVRGILPPRLHQLDAHLLLADAALVGHLLGEVLPPELAQVLDVPQIAVVDAALVVGDGGVVEPLADEPGVSLVLELDPPLGVALAAGPAAAGQPAAALAGRPVLLDEVDARDRAELGQEGFDLRRTHPRGDAGEVEDAALSQLGIEVLRLLER
mmetsp:Transcript_31081/g.90956  ORF Transcript_31081/g.90956 Transcript_31081/m.90956 type:complete len:234 (-) Transcript_31081:291-992(-)